MTKQEMIKAIADLDNESKKEFYDILRAEGFMENDIFTIQSAEFFYKMFYHDGFYEAVKSSISEVVCREILGA